eukprot:scaffold3167_cov105-Isochrysis_galbana.AAC.1
MLILIDFEHDHEVSPVPQEVGPLAVTARPQLCRGAVHGVGRLRGHAAGQKVLDLVLLGLAPALAGGTRFAALAVTGRTHDHGEAARCALAFDEVCVGGERMDLAADRPRRAVRAPLPAPGVGAADARVADHAQLLVVGAAGGDVAGEAEGGPGLRAAVGLAALVPHVNHSIGCVELVEGAARLAGRVEERSRMAAVGLAALALHVNHSLDCGACRRRR